MVCTLNRRHGVVTVCSSCGTFFDLSVVVVLNLKLKLRNHISVKEARSLN